MCCFSKAVLLPLSALVAVLSLASQPVAHAQTQPPSVQRTDPADPKVAIPASVYRSSLSRYQAFTEPDVAPWRATNELVRQRGGWRAYAREAREPSLAPTPSPAASQPAASVKPAMPGHEMK